MKKILNKKGFTLIELLVTLAVFSVLMVAVLSFIFPSMNLFVKSSRLNSAKHAANLAMDYIEGNLASTNDCTIVEAADKGGIVTAISEDDMLVVGENITESDNYGDFKLYTKGDSLGKDILPKAVTDGLKFKLAFKQAEPDTDVIGVKIDVKDSETNEHLYTLERNIFLMNMNPGKVYSTSGGSSSGGSSSGGGGGSLLPPAEIKFSPNASGAGANNIAVYFKDYSQLDVGGTSSTSST